MSDQSETMDNSPEAILERRNKLLREMGIDPKNYYTVGGPDDPNIKAAAEIAAMVQSANTKMTKEQEQDGLKKIYQSIAAKNEKYDRVMSHSDITNIAELSERLIEYINCMYEYEQRAVRLFEINRRFGMKAYKLHTSTKKVMSEIGKLGTIAIAPFKGVIVYYPAKIIKDAWAISGLNEKDKFKKDILERAFSVMIK